MGLYSLAIRKCHKASYQKKIFFSVKHNSHLKDKSAFLFCSQNLISGISFLNRILIDFILVVLSYFIMFVLNQVPLST